MPPTICLGSISNFRVCGGSMSLSIQFFRFEGVINQELASHERRAMSSRDESELRLRWNTISELQSRSSKHGPLHKLAARCSVLTAHRPGPHTATSVRC